MPTTPTVSHAQNQKRDFQVCHVFSHLDSRPVNILLSKQSIKHADPFSRYSQSSTILEGYYPPHKVLEKMKGKIKDGDKGNNILDDILSHIPHLIALSFQQPSPRNPHSERSILILT